MKEILVQGGNSTEVGAGQESVDINESLDLGQQSSVGAGKKKGLKKTPKQKWLIGLAVFTGLLLMVLAILVGYRYFSRSTAKDQYDALMIEAAQQHNDKEFSKALATYNEALVLEPSFQAAYVGTLRILLEKNLADSAEEFVAGAGEIISGSDLGDLYLMLGEYYYQTKEWEIAYDSYKKADQLAGLEGNSIDEFAIVSVNSGNDEWKSLVSEIVNKDLQGVLQSYKGLSKSENMTLFERAKLSQKAINAEVYYFAIALLEESDDLQEYWDGLYYVGRAYYELHDYDKAAYYLDAAVQLGPDDPALQLLAARNNVMNGEYTRAFSNYDQYILYSKDNVVDESVVVEYVELLIEEERYSKAIEVLSEFESSSDSMDLLKLKIYMAQDVTADITQMIDRMGSTVDPGSDEYYMYIWLSALWYIDEGQFTKAEEILEPLDESDIDDPYYYYVMGRLINDKGNEKEADNYFKIAIEKDLDGEVSKLAINYVR